MIFRKRMMSAALTVLMTCSMCVTSTLAEDGKNKEAPEGRKEMQDTKDIVELLKNPNKIALVVYGCDSSPGAGCFTGPFMLY